MKESKVEWSSEETSHIGHQGEAVWNGDENRGLLSPGGSSDEEIEFQSHDEQANEELDFELYK